ncbi:MAG: peptide chain release factor N(5)-glutamine methyltransferase [Planctomycetes bacterium]|nr:peptide chain release factor N(5)-glutamine methyltransferase [Planctomycetota bacterium]
MKVQDAIDKATARLAAAGVPDADRDANSMAAAALTWSALDLISKGTDEFPPYRKRKFDEMVARREKREPLQYVTGSVSFAGLRLQIDKRALIPRPETEQIVDLVLAHRNDKPARMLDVCTGSGAIALAAKKGWKELSVLGSDVSQEALLLARENAKKLKLEVNFVRADLLRPFLMPFHVITANPPYVTEAEFPALQAEVRDWEPRQALVSGPEGTTLLDRIPEDASHLLWPGGLLAVEMAPAQTAKFADSLDRTRDFDSIRVLKDFQGLDRIVTARRWKNS